MMLSGARATVIVPQHELVFDSNLVTVLRDGIVVGRWRHKDFYDWASVHSRRDARRFQLAELEAALESEPKAVLYVEMRTRMNVGVQHTINYFAQDAGPKIHQAVSTYLDELNRHPYQQEEIPEIPRHRFLHSLRPAA